MNKNKMDIDPYKFIGVPKNFTPDQLKAAYKKMALVMHPDKQGGNDYMFKLLTTCYKTLVKEYNKSIADRQFHELKSEAQKSIPKYSPNPETIDIAKKSFNIDKFNNVFDQNKLPDVTRDTGYDDWLKNAADNESKKFKGKFTSTAFNQHFEKNTEVEPSKHLIKYKEPEPMFTGKKIQYTELGVDLEDFSGENLSRKNLNYMDLKLAHTTSRIVDPKTVNERKSYKTVDDVESDRANVSYNMSEAQIREHQKQQKIAEIKEKQRLQNLNQYDLRNQEQFEKVNRLMLGGR
jgi:curved DNA-binding protein CbpA